MAFTVTPDKTLPLINMPIRFYAPQAEAKYIWLAGILETFYLFDSQVEAHLKKIAKCGVIPACSSGCHACCLEPAVPISELEMKAISWYASEVLSGGLRAQVKKRLIEYSSRLECPFLVDCACSIYAVRPLDCRRLFIKSKRCETGEDVHKTRPLDIVRLPKKTLIQSIAEDVQDMRLYDWAQIANNIEDE